MARRPPSRADGRGSFSVATYNVRCGRNAGLESALRAMAATGVDLGIFTETKITDGVYTRFSSGYNVTASNAVSACQGGIALFWRENELYEVEEVATRGPNVLTFELVTGQMRYFVVGAYIPPSDLGTTLAHIQQAWSECPRGCEPLLLGDLNANLINPRDEREDGIAEQTDIMNVVDMGRHFRQRRRRRCRGRWTWRMRRGEKTISSQCDYLMARVSTRRRFRRVRLVDPRYHDSDHRAIVARISSGCRRDMQQYRRNRQHFPITLPRNGPRTELESLFEELQSDCEAPPIRDRPANAWISQSTWSLVDRRASMRKSGTLSQQYSRILGRSIRQSLKDDRALRAANVADEVETHLEAGDPKEAWRRIKGWYRSVEDRPPKPNYQRMETLTQERIDLYTAVPPPGAPIPINVDPFDVNDEIPTDGEIREAVKSLRNGRAGGLGGMRAEHLKRWLRDIEEEEQEDKRGRGDKWRVLVQLIQTIWEHGSIPQQMTWMVIVLLPKGGGDYRGIGLLEPLWKVVEVLMDKRFLAIEFHDCLHGFLAGRGTGTATMEVKLAQQLAYREQEAWYQIFLDLRKAYDAMDRGRCLEILAGYGVGPKLIRLLSHFWAEAKLACRTGGYYGSVFSAGRGVTQGGPFSPRIFNVVVDAVVREWLRQSLGEEAARHGLGDLVATIMVAFYADDGVLSARCPEWLQESFTTLVGLFECVGLRTNAQKTKVMTCIPGRIRVSRTEEVYTDFCHGASTHAARKRLRVECNICNQSMQAASLRGHLETQHDVFRSFVLNREIGGNQPPATFRAISDIAAGLYYCPVPGCCGEATTPKSLRWHFVFRHPQHLVVIPREGSVPLPRCLRCRMQTPVESLNRGHQQTEQCQGMYEMRLQHEAAARSQDALQQEFFCGGDELEKVEVFKYLGRMLTYDDNDTQAMRVNLNKARKCWARISRVLKAENATPRVCGVFYKATVMAVLLFGSETWNLAPSSLKRLEGFHHRAAWRMAGTGPRLNPDGSWTYPNTEAVMKEVGLRSISHYVEVRRQHIFNFIVNRPIFDLCRESVRKRGSSPRLFWWDQPLTLADDLPAGVDDDGADGADP